MHISTVLGFLFFGVIVGAFAYGFGLNYGRKNPKEPGREDYEDPNTG